MNHVTQILSRIESGDPTAAQQPGMELSAYQREKSEEILDTWVSPNLKSGFDRGLKILSVGCRDSLWNDRLMTNLKIIALTVTTIFGSVTTVHSAGPTSAYYLTDGDSSTLQVVQTGTIVNAWGTGFTLYPLAVADTVKVYKVQQSVEGGGDGIEYTLSGTPTGATYPWQAGPSELLLDGATDGVSHNYACEFIASEVFDGNKGVWQFDLDWKNPVLLFAENALLLGITYDQVDQNIWISKDGGNIQEVAMDGEVLQEFYPGAGRWAALAWEPSTDTLWAINNNGSSYSMRQWQKDGTLLDEVTIDGLSPNVWGGEFAVPAIPEPSTLVLLMFATAGWCLRR